MSPLKKVYHLSREIRERLPLKKWSALGLAMMSIGIVRSEHNWVSKIAEKLAAFGKPDTVERRLQRWLANERIDLSACCRAWAKWVLGSLVDSKRVVLLVDITKLGERMDVLMVGLAYRQRCIPLAWRCLRGGHKWPVRQNDLLMELLEWVCEALPAHTIPLIQADRGIGTSPDLIRRIDQRGWHYLFRIQNAVFMRLDEGYEGPVGDLLPRGKRWQGQAQVFKDAGWLDTLVHFLWRSSMAEPWCLVTNDPDTLGPWYAARNWQEQSFRDLKSGGWHWHLSRIRQPAHADRLLLALSLAYAWMLSLGTSVIRAGRATLRQLCRGRRQRYSVFRLGLRYFQLAHSSRSRSLFQLYFRPNLCHF